MKITIKNNESKLPTFSTLEIGDVFKYSDNVNCGGDEFLRPRMKIGHEKAIILENKAKIFPENDWKVVPLNIVEIVLEEVGK